MTGVAAVPTETVYGSDVFQPPTEILGKGSFYSCSSKKIIRDVCKSIIGHHSRLLVSSMAPVMAVRDHEVISNVCK